MIPIYQKQGSFWFIEDKKCVKQALRKREHIRCVGELIKSKIKRGEIDNTKVNVDGFWISRHLGGMYTPYPGVGS